MRNVIAIPVLILIVILQSAIVSRITLLSGSADLLLIVLAAWALQEQVDSSWHWAIFGGALIGFMSRLPWIIPLTAYLLEVLMAQILRKRVWQAPLLAMFTIIVFGTLVYHLMALLVLNLSGTRILLGEAIRVVSLPSILLNMLLAIPIYALVRDFANWLYPTAESI
ncbi:MAG: hypothetical protein JXA13_02215 [Anaerolineales bacterium]|nr:hypothetical protein [Anaerolineales bacterium]